LKNVDAPSIKEGRHLVAHHPHDGGRMPPLLDREPPHIPILLTPVLSWQDQRTTALCDRIRGEGHGPLVRDRSGLPLDPMFSAAKARWLLDEMACGQERARQGNICIGTVDAWLLSRFGGAPVIEAGNASRTQLLNTRVAAWDNDLLDLFDVPEAALPRIVPSIGPFPSVRGLSPLPDGVPVLAVMGDSHAALFGHGARSPGEIKATYGTGSSVMGLIDDVARLDPGLCLTIAWSIDRPAFAAEGNIRATGATLRWVADVFGITSAELADLAASAESHGVSLIPAFNGLGAPWWDTEAVGLLSGLTLATSRQAIARAALESIPHQVADVLDAIDRSVGRVRELFVDGGPTRNDALMQAQADLAGRTVIRSDTAELSALGAAHLAGLQAGLWSWERLAAFGRDGTSFEPGATSGAREAARAQWAGALARARFRLGQ
jgi:glycerol kinase